MGSKKTNLLEKIKEGDQVGKEAVEAGEQLEGDGSEIKSILDGIDTSMDEDDVSAVRNAESGYSSDFKAAFSDTVETKASEMKEIETEAMNESRTELGKVTDAVSAFQEMAGITDVGRRNAEGASDSLRNSAAEYEEYIDEANNIIDDTQSSVDSLKSSIDALFG